MLLVILDAEGYVEKGQLLMSSTGETFSLSLIYLSFTLLPRLDRTFEGKIALTFRMLCTVDFEYNAERLQGN